MIKGYPNKQAGEVKTLKTWFEELQITKEPYTYPTSGNTYEEYKSAVKQDHNGWIEIFGRGGYGISYSKLDSYMDQNFIMMNNDIDDAKLVLVIR